jgi:cobalamin-dependent methionine synthase I
MTWHGLRQQTEKNSRRGRDALNSCLSDFVAPNLKY